ncbi:MAG: cytochrome c maturation protein CcmE [Algiphilus sp.]|nr:cytochrome c maturation protein CcmE [Algiphilus sp.]MCI5063890.1 cytochrome c maturation protein CcmE [Algiphilus sp.]MCI5104919.1 cytochrome c maturation protein CcmE [Algiphilus sp.]
MKMTARRQRMAWIALLLVVVGAAAALASAAFRENLMYFHTPTDIASGEVPSSTNFRLGGLVTTGSVDRDPDSLNVAFRLADCDHEVQVQYSGILPDLFREGQGIVTMGYLDDEGTFQAQQVLAKHDENYMPPELAERLADETGHSCEPFKPVRAGYDTGYDS